MKKMTWFMVGVVPLVVLALAGVANAATITWGSATLASADSDVSTTDTVVGAYDFTNNGNAGNLTVNTVLFETWLTMSTAQTDNSVTFTWTGPISGQADRQSIPTGGGIGASYARLMGSFAGTETSTQSTLTLSGLTDGQEYLFQVWCTDPINSVRNTLVDGAVTLRGNASGTTGGLGDFVIGTFTASGDQAITFDNGAGDGFTGYNVSALQLRAVPEPATLALLASGGIVMLLKRRRKA